MLKVIWGEIAKESYFNELERINIYHTNREVKNFINLVDELIFNLRTKVLLGKVSKKTKINSFVISKQTTLFFDLDKENSRIELLLFW
jgi:hypothetical protein